MMRWIFTLIIAALLAVPDPATAGFLSKLGRMAGDAADGAKKVDGVGGTDIPSTALRAAKDPNGSAVALSVSDTGTVRLTDELGRATDIGSVDDVDSVLKSLGGKNVSVVADTASLGRNIEISTRLAERGALKLWINKTALPVRLSNKDFMVELRPNVLVPVLKRSDIARVAGRPIANVSTRPLREVQYAFDKPLTRGAVVVAKFGKPPKGPRKVGFGDAATRPGETLTMTAEDVVQGLSGNRGGTVILTGRIDGDVIRTGQGPIPLTDIQRAARAADVHLVFMNGSDKAAHKVVAASDTYGDLILGLSDRRTPLIATATDDGAARVRLSFQPEVKAPTAAGGNTDVDSTIVVAGHLAGQVGSTSVDVFTTDRNEEEDRKVRLIPWLSFGQHLFFGASILFGLLGHRPAWWFWRKVWVLPTGSRPWRVARGVGYVVFMLFTGIFWGTIRYLFGWVAWFVPAWRRPKPA